MKVIVAGSRNIGDHRQIFDAIEESGFNITELISGCARGVDTIGEFWAAHNKIPVKRFRANWRLHKKAAGFIRNAVMADYADALIAIWDGESRGTKQMIQCMWVRNKPVYTKYFKPGLPSGDGAAPTKQSSGVRSSTPAPSSGA